MGIYKATAEKKTYSIRTFNKSHLEHRSDCPVSLQRSLFSNRPAVAKSKPTVSSCCLVGGKSASPQSPLEIEPFFWLPHWVAFWWRNFTHQSEHPALLFKKHVYMVLWSRYSCAGIITRNSSSMFTESKRNVAFLESRFVHQNNNKVRNKIHFAALSEQLAGSLREGFPGGGIIDRGGDVTAQPRQVEIWISQARGRR